MPGRLMMPPAMMTASKPTTVGISMVAAGKSVSVIRTSMISAVMPAIMSPVPMTPGIGGIRVTAEMTKSIMPSVIRRIAIQSIRAATVIIVSVPAPVMAGIAMVSVRRAVMAEDPGNNMEWSQYDMSQGIRDVIPGAGKGIGVNQKNEKTTHYKNSDFFHDRPSLLKWPTFLEKPR